MPTEWPWRCTAPPSAPKWAERLRQWGRMRGFSVDLGAGEPLDEAPLRSGGGTDFHDLLVKAARIRPSIVVILTDLDVPLPPAPGFPVLWAVPHAVTVPPYGQVIRIGNAR